MRKLGIARIGRDNRFQPVAVSILQDLRHEIVEPLREFRLCQHATHRVCLTQAGREKIFTRRFVIENNPYQRGRTFSLNPQPPWQKNRFWLSARNPASGRDRTLSGHAPRSAPDARVSAAMFSIVRLLRLRADADSPTSPPPDRSPM